MKRALFGPALFVPALLMAVAPGAEAHEVRPAYLELRQTGPDRYDVLWKVPGRGDLRLGLYAELPAACVSITEPSSSSSGAAHVDRWTVDCPGGLSRGTIRIAGLDATVIDVLVRLERLDGSTEVKRLTPSDPSFVVAAAANAVGVARTYTRLGVEHILSGIDHLLFVLALIIITRGGWNLVRTVTAFTVSHSITLTLATLGYVRIPQAPVEATIALSIVFVAAEILRGRQGHHGLAARAPWIVALLFGLMHGLGFASGLKDAGLPDGHIPTALLFFSLGVETGHLLFIGFVLACVALLRRGAARLASIDQRRWAILETLPPYAIGGVAMFWVIQRIAAFSIPEQQGAGGAPENQLAVLKVAAAR